MKQFLIGLGVAISVVSSANPARELTALVEVARKQYFLGKQVEKEPTPFFEEGLRAAEEARKLSPDHLGAMLWWAANKGAIADIKRNLAALKTITEVEKVLLDLKEKSPAYGYAAADRALGVLYHKAPGFISIGSNKKALKHLREAVSAAPEYPGNSLALAEFLDATGEEEEAKKIAQELLGNKVWREKDFGDFTPERSEWESRLAKWRLPEGAK